MWAWLFAIGSSLIPLVAGASVAHSAISFGLVFCLALVLDISSQPAFTRGAAARPNALTHLVTACRSVPHATRFMAIALMLTCLFSFELQFDIVPNSLGVFEMLTPVIICSILFDLSGGLFCAALATAFGFFTFAPPRFPGIIDLGPSLGRPLASFILASLCCAVFFASKSEGLLTGAQTPLDRQKAARMWGMLRAAAVKSAGSAGVAWLIIPSLVIAYGLFWATYAQVSSSLGVHIDSLEAFAWGREFRLGYYKHPPFWAWVAGLWFMVSPKTDWSFWLLSEINGAIGLAGAYALMGRFCGQRMRVICVLLLMLTPFYQFNALRFNANTILLSIWPWTMYFFVRSIEKPRLIPALACGLLAGFALLSKYFAVVLIGSCFLASLTHHNRRAYYASAAPYLSVLVALGVFAPHVIWLFRDGFQPLAYMATKIDLRDQAISSSFFQFIGASAAFFALPLALLALARWRGGASKATMPESKNGQSFENVIAFSPFILTLIAGSVGHTALAIPFGVPIFAMAALALLRIFRPDEAKSLHYARGAVIALMIGCCIAAPAIPRVFASLKHKDHIEPRSEAADAAIALWREKTGAPLRFVSGDRGNSLAITFRSADDTSEFNGFNMRWSPSVTPDGLRQHGLLVLCFGGNSSCPQDVSPYLGPRSSRHDIKVARAMPGAPVFDYSVFIIPPEGG